MDNHFSSKEIKELRMSLKLTQSQFARRMKVDVITISRWERGTQRPKAKARRQLARLGK